MTAVKASKNGFSLRAYRGDAKTLLAFNFDDKKYSRNLAGFTMLCQPKGQPPYYIHELQFKNAGAHAQDPKEPPNSSINAPVTNFSGCTFLVQYIRESNRSWDFTLTRSRPDTSTPGVRFCP